MKCAEPMRRLGAVDIAPFCAALARQPESLWTADLALQKRVAPKRETQTIYLLMATSGLHNPPQRMAGWEPLREVFEPLCAEMTRFYRPGGRVMIAQVALMHPGGTIPRHTDSGPLLEACHRIHAPLETHDDVVFEVDGTNVKLEVGQAYELDNMRPHSVLNASPVRRIHLIVDYLEPAAVPVAAA